MKKDEPDHLDRYANSPQWPWAVAILLVLVYGLWSGA